MANDVKITVVNETDDFQNIIIFQQEDQLNRMFNTLFPLAWKVFPLLGKAPGIERKGSTIYPIQQGVGVVRTPATEDKLPFGELQIYAEADWKDKFKYFLTENSAQDMSKLPGKNDDDSITCLNDTGERVAIALYKNGSNIVAQPKVDSGDEAGFLLTPKLYFMYLNNIKEGDIFKSQVTGPTVKEAEITGKKTVKATLMYDPNGTGGKKMWKIEMT